MTKPKLRKNAEINPAQSPHDGIHTCSKGCSKPGCTRTLRDTIEEQDKQIEALKRDVLEAAARLRSVAEDNKRECEATRIENARLKAEVERLTKAGAWQPMETAPFDSKIRIIVDRNDDGEVGIIWSRDVQYYSVEQYPDWWMPLPVAPAEEGNEQP